MAARKTEANLGDFYRAFYRFDVFSGKFNFRHLVLYSMLLFVLEVAVGYFFSSFVLGSDISRSWIQSVIGIPLLLFIVYGLFNIILNAFEKTKKSFTEGFLVFLSISFMYLIIVQLLTIINVMVQSQILSAIISIVLFLLLVYYVVVLIMNLKNYYSTSWQRILVSFMLVDVMIGMALVFSALSGVIV